MGYDVLRAVDHINRTVDTSVCRFFCSTGRAGTKGRNPSDAAWAGWREICGIDKNQKRRKLTMREAVLLLTRAHIKAICKRLGIDAPVGPDGEDISRIADQYLKKLAEEGAFADRVEGVIPGLDHLDMLALFSDMTGRRVLEVAHKFTGESSISPSTVRRRLLKHGLPPIQLNKIYTPAEIRRIVTALQAG